jgi:hypothetical protein
MDTLLYWLDRGDWIAQLQHAWIWASLTTLLTIATILGIAAIGRHYDAVERRFEQQRGSV